MILQNAGLTDQGGGLGAPIPVSHILALSRFYTL